VAGSRRCIRGTEAMNHCLRKSQGESECILRLVKDRGCHPIGGMEYRGGQNPNVILVFGTRPVWQDIVSSLIRYKSTSTLVSTTCSVLPMETLVIDEAIIECLRR